MVEHMPGMQETDSTPSPTKTNKHKTTRTKNQAKCGVILVSRTLALRKLNQRVPKLLATEKPKWKTKVYCNSIDGKPC